MSYQHLKLTPEDITALRAKGFRVQFPDLAKERAEALVAKNKANQARMQRYYAEQQRKLEADLLNGEQTPSHNC
jgi:hypothetical protein